MESINRYVVSVRNISNNRVHFERVIDLPSSVQFPYEKVNSSLLFLFNGLDVSVDVSCHSFNSKMTLQNG